MSTQVLMNSHEQHQVQTKTGESMVLGVRFRVPVRMLHLTESPESHLMNNCLDWGLE